MKILSVRFDLWMKRYEKYLSITVANDVNDQLVAAVKENAEDLPGVSVEQSYTRVYADSKYFLTLQGISDRFPKMNWLSIKKREMTAIRLMIRLARPVWNPI